MGNLLSFSFSVDNTVNLCYSCTFTRVNYTRKLKKNLKALDDALQEFEELRDDVKRDVDRADIQRLEPLNQVQGWLRRADTIIREAEELINRGPQEIEKLCFRGYFSRNCKSSYKFGLQVANKLEEIANQKSKGVFDKVARSEPAIQADVRPLAPTVGLESTLDKVWRLLQDNQDVGIVGLYGSGGVGKTTLLTHINNRLCSIRTRPYDVVIWVVVSKDYHIEKVQDQIGEKVGLSDELWKKKCCLEKSIEIFRILSKRKFMLFLDDLWEQVDLVKVGIPPLNAGSNSKVVFTTRFQDVCGKMEAQEKIRVACLGEGQAWKLFRQKVGEQILKGHPEIEELAKRVAAECAGLPLALITIGRAMSCKKSPQEWKYALQVLQAAAYKFTQLEDEVYPLLKFSYDSLPNDTIRSCLLYCSLYPEDHNIDKRCLIDYWFYEGFLNEFNGIDRARMQGYNILGSLVNACLLEEVEDDGEIYVKMHDVIRDMTFWIAGGCDVAESRVSVHEGVQQIEAVNVGKWEDVKRMSIRVQDQIQDLITTTPTCPNLQTLFLHYNSFEVIGDGFFQFMPNLKVLDLSYNRDLKNLPEGISELVSLECLNLSFTGVKVLPIKLKTLAELRFLNVWSTNLEIPQQLISSFQKLQEIKISLQNPMVLAGGNDYVWHELGCLQNLKSASFKISSVGALEKLLTLPNLKRSTEEIYLVVQYGEMSIDVLSLAYMESLNMLHISNCYSMEEMKMKRERVGEAGMSKTPYHLPTDACLFRTLATVTLSECQGLKDVTWLMLASNLTYLEVDTSRLMEEVISKGKLSEIVEVVGNQYPTPFGNLQTLTLRNLSKLKSIYWDALPVPFLNCMLVENCPKLKKLPLNSGSAKGNQITIQGKRKWWDELEWQDESTRYAFLPCFKEILIPDFLRPPPPPF